MLELTRAASTIDPHFRPAAWLAAFSVTQRKPLAECEYCGMKFPKPGGWQRRRSNSTGRAVCSDGRFRSRLRVGEVEVAAEFLAAHPARPQPGARKNMDGLDQVYWEKWHSHRRQVT